MWRRSWLSREVLLFSAFSAVACLYAAALWLKWPLGIAFGGLTLLLGFGGVTASACIYRVPSRPAWNTPLTLMQFNLTALTLGPLFAAATGAGSPRWLAVASALAAGGQFVVLALKFFNLNAGTIEAKASSMLLTTSFRRLFITRGVLLALGSGPVRYGFALALTVLLGTETIKGINKGRDPLIARSAHPLVGITAHQPDSVPGLGQRRRVRRLQRANHIPQPCTHPRTPTPAP